MLDLNNADALAHEECKWILWMAKVKRDAGRHSFLEDLSSRRKQGSYEPDAGASGPPSGLKAALAVGAGCWGTSEVFATLKAA